MTIKGLAKNEGPPAQQLVRGQGLPRVGVEGVTPRSFLLGVLRSRGVRNYQTWSWNAGLRRDRETETAGEGKEDPQKNAQ